MASKDLEQKVAEKNQQENEKLLGHVSDDVWCAIFKYLNNKSKFKLALTCKRFKKIIESYSDIYKTFKIVINTNNVERLRKFDRPIADVTFTRVEGKKIIYFDLSVQEFFSKNGKFVQKIIFDTVDLNDKTFFFYSKHTHQC